MDDLIDFSFIPRDNPSNKLKYESKDNHPDQISKIGSQSIPPQKQQGQEQQHQTQKVVKQKESDKKQETVIPEWASFDSVQVCSVEKLNINTSPPLAPLQEVNSSNSSTPVSSDGIVECKGDSSRKQNQYSVFIKKLKDPKGNGIASYIKEFIHSFHSGDNADLIKDEKKSNSLRSSTSAAIDLLSVFGLPNSQTKSPSPNISKKSIWTDQSPDIDYTVDILNIESRVVRNFVVKTENFLKKHSLWETSTEDELNATREGLEKYVLSRLYKKIFRTQNDDIVEDQILSHRIKALEFITFQHLDIQETGDEFSGAWFAARQELHNMNGYKAPADKLVCIINCCQIINGILAASTADPGADQFLPALIFVVLTANPLHLHSNLVYISRFRHPQLLVMQTRYFYTSLTSATNFIRGITENSLTITSSEFKEGIKATVENCKEKSLKEHLKAHANCMLREKIFPTTCALGTSEIKEKDKSTLQNISSEDIKTKNAMSLEQFGISKETQKTCPMPLDDSIALSSWKARRFRFQEIATKDLLVGNVPNLLREYKELVQTLKWFEKHIIVKK